MLRRMTQTLTLSRAAHLIGVPRAELQQRIHDGELPSFDGMVTADDLLHAYPQATLDDTGAFEKVVGIRDDAFAKRLRERVLPSQEVLARRLFTQAQELAEARRHLTRYHTLLDAVRTRLDQLPAASASTLAAFIDEQLAAVLASTASGDAAAMIDAMGSALRVMSAQVSLRPSGREFFVDGSDTLLKAALSAGLSPNYGCGNGTCGLCKCRVIDGEVRQVVHSDYPFSAAERAQGFALMCCTTAVSSELTIEALEADVAADVPEQRILTKVRSIDALSPRVTKLHLQTPRSNRLRFLAGQRVTLGLTGSNDVHGEFAIASCPCDDRNLVLHIARDDQRAQSAGFADALFSGRLRAGDEVSVWGPWGDFILAKENTRPLLFVAVDHGFAPIASLIEHGMALDETVPMSLLWLSADADGHYLANQARAWASALDDFSFTPLVAYDLADALAAALATQRPLNASAVYLAGPAAAVDALTPVLLAAGADAAHLHTEGW